VNDLNPVLKQEVTRVYNRNLQFTLELLFTEALAEESDLRPGPSNKPEYKCVDVPKPQVKKCRFYHGVGHTGGNCPKIAARKAREFGKTAHHGKKKLSGASSLRLRRSILPAGDVNFPCVVVAAGNVRTNRLPRSKASGDHSS
jgi:hypothetical protein